jgi:hypothetical protein
MSLGNMRSLGISRVDAYTGCGCQTSVDIPALADEEAVPAERLRCSNCGPRLAETRPDWSQYRGGRNR